jgi:MOSC domain-containing protein YiiM
MSSVVAVHRSPSHSMCKQPQLAILLRAGLGVEGDAHQGVTVKHRSRARQAPGSPNLRQVHLLGAELHDELAQQGFDVVPGQMGENITTAGVDLLALPTGARLHLGDEAVVEITGLRNPCSQLDKIQYGLMKATLERREDGFIIRKAGVMGIVLEGGTVQPGDPIRVELPAKPHRPLAPV